MRKLKIGDRVILRSPEYDVSGCKAEVCRIDDGNYIFRILDNTIFDHGRFKGDGEHYITAGDTYKPDKPVVKLPEELFTL